MMGLLREICLVLVLCISVQAFPADTTGSHQFPKKGTSSDGKQRTATSNTSNQKPRYNSSSLMTTSSLLFKDTKPILTYLLGQPKKQGSLSSPAHLLSPDRYEFFTFDDDGQIVKKLMSVKEIQKIIANTEKAFTGEHGAPIEYYQILSVTPDVESIPSVSRINPNEPLFSIHDVIASVQNVLKSEINIKQSQLKPDNSDSSSGSPQYEVLTKTPQLSYLGPNQKLTSSLGSESVFLKKLQGSSTEANKDNQDPTTRHADDQYIGSLLQGDDGTESREGVESVDVESSKTTDSESPSTLNQSQDGVTPPKTAKISTTTAIPMQTFVLMQQQTSAPGSEDSTTVKAVIVPMINDQAIPLSLSDAHPAIISNDSWSLDMEPFTFTQNWRIEEADAEEVSPSSSQGAAETTAKIENLETDSKQESEIENSSAFETETATTGDQISITPDLANSVSSVLWQIVSENALLDNVSKSTEVPQIDKIISDVSETFETSETKHPGQTNSAPLLPTDSDLTQNAESDEKAEENPFTVLETILRTQAKPTSIRPLAPVEKVTTDEVDTKSEEPSTTSVATESNIEVTSELAKEETSTETRITESASESFEGDSAVPDSQTVQKNADDEDKISSTTTTSSSVITVSPDVVFQSPEHIKPVTDKVASLVLSPNNATKEDEKVVDVQISPEANSGHIPRTTEFPGQVVKEIQRIEPVDPVFAKEEPPDELESEGGVVTTTLYQSVADSTTPSDKVEPKEEDYVETFSSENPQQSTESVATEQTEPHKVTSADEVDITFVPMVIKPSVKNETEQADAKEDKLEVREQEDAAELDASTVSPPEQKDDDLESKKLPDGESDLPSGESVTTTVTKEQNKVANDAPSSIAEEEIGSLKYNPPTKYGTSGKPQSSSYAKPTKVKPQADSKPSKPSLSLSKPGIKEPAKGSESKKPYENHLQSSPSLLELEAAPPENLGLEKTVANLDEDIKRFSELCNELAFSLWSSVTHNGLSFVRSLVISPFAVTSLLAMVFLGARGPTSGQMNDVLKLDDMVTFNPHLVFRNVTESLIISRNPDVATAAFVRELYSDKSKGKLLDFYKERAQQFYDGHVEEINFKTVGETIRRQTNHLVKRQTWGKMTDFMRTSNLVPKPPLAAFGANIFQTDCSKASIKDRDGEMYFVILPASRLRRLVPIPAAVWRSDFLAGYEPQLDATAVSIGSPNAVVSTIFVLPGQQGLIAPGDTLARLEHHLLGSPYRKGHWTKLMKSLLPRPGLELQIPRMSHKSVVNVTSSLQRMGLKDLFSADKADLTGLNGLANDLHLSDMLQVNLFSTCGEEPVGARHHSEVYPATPILRREKSFDGVSSDSIDNLFAVSDFEDPAISALPLELRPRQARLPLSKPGAKIPEPPRLRFDRPFLFFVRHNPTGLILHMGRFNPRLIP